jgi:hypothetical protein
LVNERVETVTGFVLAKAGTIPKINNIAVLTRNERASELDVVLTIWPSDMEQTGIKTKRPILELCAAKYKYGISDDEKNIQPTTSMNTRDGDFGKLLFIKKLNRITLPEIAEIVNARITPCRKCRANRRENRGCIHSPGKLAYAIIATRKKMLRAVRVASEYSPPAKPSDPRRATLPKARITKIPK